MGTIGGRDSATTLSEYVAEAIDVLSEAATEDGMPAPEDEWQVVAKPRRRRATSSR